MEDLLLDSDKKPSGDLVVHIRWWERKRWIFASLILILQVYLFLSAIRPERYYYDNMLIQSAIFFVLANVGYCAGWGIDVLVRYYLKKDGLPIGVKWLLFISGTIFSLIVTLGYMLFIS